MSKLVEVVGGELIAGSGDAMVNGLATDSREVEPGAVFVAFPGEHTDGHEHLAEAVRQGARALLVTRVDDGIVAASGSGVRSAALVRVGDPLEAVQQLAAHHRDRLFCPVVAVTGSTGKTTTKDFLAAVLGARYRVVATRGNRNNDLGVPLTLMEAGADTEVVVLEMAMRGSGQIGRLCRVARPDFGLVTNVGVTHIELLGSLEAIQAAKAELVTAVPPHGAVFLNADDEMSGPLAELSAAPVTLYGLGERADVRASAVETSPEGEPSFRLEARTGGADVKLSIPGRHNVYNALAAIAVGEALGVAPATAAEALREARVSDMRMQVFLTADGVTVVNDAYNASPASMRAALETLASMEAAGRRIAVLGDMRELGSLAELAHFQLGEHLAALPIDVLMTVGDLGRRIAEGARAEGMDPAGIRSFTGAGEAADAVSAEARAGDVVLVKASRALGLESVVERMAD